jgi:hypothetical protein
MSNHNIRIAYRAFENMAKLKYLGSTEANQNLIHEKIKRRLNSGNACYHSVQNILSSHLLSKSVRNKMCKTITLYGCETLSLTLREEHKLKVFGNGALRRIFGLKRDEVVGGCR